MEHPQAKKKTYFARLWVTMQKEVQETKRRYKGCGCCCLCSRLMLNELSTNNQVCNLFIVKSRLFPRSLRLLFFFLGMIVELAMCALFYDLSAEEEETHVFSAQHLISNFWIGLYTCLFSLPLLLSVGLCFRVKASFFRGIADLERIQEVLSLRKCANLRGVSL